MGPCTLPSNNIDKLLVIAEKDVCHPNPCQHGGECKDEGGTASCKCIGEWKGATCKGKLYTIKPVNFLDFLFISDVCLN